jgi:hypothetical protein
MVPSGEILQISDDPLLGIKIESSGAMKKYCEWNEYLSHENDLKVSIGGGTSE